MHGGRHSNDNVGVITGNATLPAHVTVCAISTACPRKSVLVHAKSRLYARGHHTPRTCTLSASTLLVAEEMVADTTLVRCYQLNKSPHVVAAAAVGQAAGSADLRPSTAAVVVPRLHTAPASPLTAAEAARSPYSNAPSSPPAGAMISCLKIRCCQTLTRCLCGAPRCRKTRESCNVHTRTQI